MYRYLLHGVLSMLLGIVSEKELLDHIELPRWLKQ